MTETLTITDQAKRAITAVFNESVVAEYSMILNYPRIIDHIVNFEKITDAQLIGDINKLGTDSLHHFGVTDKIIGNLGSQIVWAPSTLPRLVGVPDMLETQLKNEKAARAFYIEARKIAAVNKVTRKSGGFFSAFTQRNIPEENIVQYDLLIRDIDRLILDEERHIRIVEDSLVTIKSLLSK